MNVGIEIRFKDGTKDWIDPVDEDDFDVMQANAKDEYVINNGYHKYYFKVDEVQELLTYKLCPECGFDARGDRHSRDCKLDNLNDDKQTHNQESR